jgi:cephalosporin-C deacetylase-like acetyl esterase
MRGTLAIAAASLLVSPLAAQTTLPGTKPLTAEGDLATQMVAGIDKYLTRELAASAAKRKQFWKQDFSSPEAYARSVEPNRQRLRKLLGVIDERLPVKDLEYVATTSQPALVAETAAYKVYTVRWPVLPGVHGEGLLLEPKGKPVACVVALGDADATPEALAGLDPKAAAQVHLAHLLAEQGCRVLIPTLVNRADTFSGNPKLGRMTNQPHREFVYRMAFEMGRHVIGYEIQRVLAAVDWFTRDKGHPPVGVYGHGEGGLIALYSAALDPRIQATGVSGYFGPRERVWQEPIYRNVWGLLREFGDAEVAALIAPRTLVVQNSEGPQIAGPPPARKGRSGAAPGELRNVPEDSARAEVERARAFAYGRLKLDPDQGLFLEKAPAAEANPAVKRFLIALVGVGKERLHVLPPADQRIKYDPAPRQRRQFDELVEFTQKLLPESEARREEFFADGDRSSPEKWAASMQHYRDYFWDEVIGKLPAPTMPLNVRTRLVYDEPKWKGYEVVLDLYEDVFCYGILLVPTDLKPGEKRPVVVCQHGLEGRPTDIVNPKVRTRYYNSFGAQLADRGFIVFAPQNPYIGGNTFRQLQRKANPLKLSIYSFIVRQHERILQWLRTLLFVDGTRIAYYGLSYGGKVAMRIPAILLDYCLSICSGDFNEWIWKNITLYFRSSYMFTGEYEMYEFDLGNTFNYAEMAYLISPRPFMVERGHDDGVGMDEQVAYEYAKVRRHYARLRIPERTAIEFFSGGHEVRGQGTFAFLSRHLNWPPRAKP